MIKLLPNSNFVETSQKEKDRKLDVEVLGNINENKIVSKIVEIAQIKAKEIPVIIMLDSIEECEYIKEQF